VMLLCPSWEGLVDRRQQSQVHLSSCRAFSTLVFATRFQDFGASGMGLYILLIKIFAL
jgi:hypothetical protein